MEHPVILPSALYVVATPIGNRDDISTRAQTVLASVNLIAAEDTRHSRILLDSLGIRTPLIALHEHNERQTAHAILEKIKQGESVALISDAGTPLLSDPGYFLVRQAQEENIQVIPIPGACAAITALSAAGLPTDRFCFEGFLPAKSASRKKFLEQLKQETRTIIFYESPHRIMESVTDIAEVFGDQREAVIARELTKKFETIRRANLATLIKWMKEDENQQKGEFVIIVHGAILDEDISEQDQEAIRILKILCEEMPMTQAVKLVASITGLKKNHVYELGLQK
jgi:16S rRNA (cytidine1402-2'-O)-methyltransferase